MRHMYTFLFLLAGTIIILPAIKYLVEGASVTLQSNFGLFHIAMGFGLWALLGNFKKRRSPTATDVRQSDVATSSTASAETLSITTESDDSRPGSAALIRRMTTQLLNALKVWLFVVILISLAGSFFLQDTSYALTTGLSRFGLLFWPGILIIPALYLSKYVVTRATLLRFM